MQTLFRLSKGSQVSINELHTEWNYPRLLRRLELHLILESLYLSKPSQSIEECELYQHFLLSSLIHTHIKTKTEGWALYMWEGDFSHITLTANLLLFFQDNDKPPDNKASM